MISARQNVYDPNPVLFDGLTKYLSEITRYSMEEYLLEVDKYPVLSDEEEQALAERVYHEEDESACERLVLCNLRLVARIALDSCHDTRAASDPADDVVTALYRWSTGATTTPKALMYRRALPAVAGE